MTHTSSPMVETLEGRTMLSAAAPMGSTAVVEAPAATAAVTLSRHEWHMRHLRHARVVARAQLAASIAGAQAAASPAAVRAAPLAIPGTGTAIYSRFLGIQGDVTDRVYNQWIDMTTVATSVSNTGAAGSQSTPANAEFTREVDLASPKLLGAAARVTRFSGVQVDLVTFIGGKAQPYARYVFGNAVLQQVRHEYGPYQANESLSLKYSTLDVTYFLINSATGKVGGSVPFHYDFTFQSR